LAIEYIHTYLVHPNKGSPTKAQIGGTAVPLKGKLFRLLQNIFSSDDELDIAISFNQSLGGKQQNACRDLLLAYVSNPTLPRGPRIAERLAQKSDHRSGLGLLFLIAGKEGKEHKLVISRFPTDTAILAEEKQAALTVEFLERVFLKSATSSKAVAYQDDSLISGFWLGRAIDKQINSRVTEVSNYWVFDFLDSGFQITPASGTRRLALAIREAARKTEDITVKSEITAAATLAGGFGGRRTSIRGFIQHLGLSPPAANAIVSELKAPSVADEQFQFDAGEFKSQVVISPR
jgi:hypothetical protein